MSRRSWRPALLTDRTSALARPPGQVRADIRLVASPCDSEASIIQGRRRRTPSHNRPDIDTPCAIGYPKWILAWIRCLGVFGSPHTLDASSRPMRPVRNPWGSPRSFLRQNPHFLGAGTSTKRWS